MSKTVEKARSAETGRFIPMEEAIKHPKTTVVEKVNFCGIPIDSAEKDDWFLGSKTPPEPIK